MEFSAEDATRTDRAYLKQVFSEVAKAGADRIDIPDTVGYATPEYFAQITKDAIEATKLGYRRLHYDHPGFSGPNPTRATWGLRYPGGGSFAIEVRPSRGENRNRPCDRYAPGVHHMAFQAESPAAVDEVHEAMLGIGATVLDPPTDYGGQAGYSKGYYAVFFADPDGAKLEVVHTPGANS